MVVTQTQTKTPVLNGKSEVKPDNNDVAALKFSDLEPRKETKVDEQKRSLPENLARKVVNFERHPAKKMLTTVFSFSGLGLILNSFIGKKLSPRDKLLSIVGAIPLVFSDILYKDLLNPAAKKLIPEKHSKTDFNPDKDMIFPSAEFKEILFNGISRFLDASDRSDIELKLNHRNQKSPTMLFTGPPGVGKTEMAKFIAQKLGMELNFVTSEQESKYVGETENNLIKLFEEAKKKKQLLFFDEADTFLSQRSDIGAAARHTNAVVNTVLKQIDESGVPAIFATNGKIDEAVQSRMKVNIAFPAATSGQNYQILISQFEKLAMKPERLAEFQTNKDTLLKLFSLFEFSPRHVNNIVDDAIELVALRITRAKRAGQDALAKVDKSINLEDIKIAILRLKENLEKSSKSHMGGRPSLLDALGV